MNEMKNINISGLFIGIFIAVFCMSIGIFIGDLTIPWFQTIAEGSVFSSGIMFIPIGLGLAIGVLLASGCITVVRKVLIPKRKR